METNHPYGSPLLKGYAAYLSICRITLRGRDTTVGQHGGDMRTIFGGRHPNTNKREGRCLADNIHLITLEYIKLRLELGLYLSELAFFFTKETEPLIHFRIGHARLTRGPLACRARGRVHLPRELVR